MISPVPVNLAKQVADARRRCCLCGEYLNGERNNPEPLASSLLDCCNFCNGSKVMPARLLQMNGD